MTVTTDRRALDDLEHLDATSRHVLAAVALAGEGGATLAGIAELGGRTTRQLDNDTWRLRGAPTTGVTSPRSLAVELPALVERVPDTRPYRYTLTGRGRAAVTAAIVGTP